MPIAHVRGWSESGRPWNDAVKPKTIYIGLATIGLVLIAYYLANPLGTDSWDPRIRIVGYTLFRQPSESMNPTLQAGEIFLVSAWAYAGNDPKPGDIAVFKYPRNRSTHYVKRVIAGGGSTVEIVDGVTLVDGQVLAEPWKGDQVYVADYSLTMAPIAVPKDQYFVMGDNRDHSEDSRFWGFVPRDHFVGRVEL
jgi:signal peptidase I